MADMVPSTSRVPQAAGDLGGFFTRETEVPGASTTKIRRGGQALESLHRAVRTRGARLQMSQHLALTLGGVADNVGGESLAQAVCERAAGPQIHRIAPASATTQRTSGRGA